MLGRVIACERVRAGMRQRDLAAALGTSVSTVSGWERGERLPLAANVKAMAQLFGCSADYLLGLTEERTRRSA